MENNLKPKDKITERKETILNLLTESPDFSVSELAKKLEVSVVTLRNDLTSLEEDGLIVRRHGSALPAFHPAILQRMRSYRDEKQSIAKTAAKHIQDGDTVMIAAGTTTALIPKFLRGKRQIHIVTNNTLILPYVRTNPQLDVTFVGGAFKAEEESLTGPLTIEAVRNFRVQKAFIGVDGVDAEQGIFANSVESGDFVRQMATHAAETIVLADRAKFQNPGFVCILPWHKIHLLITDSTIPPNIEQAILENKVKLEKIQTRRANA
jgi:DeoR family galactitol utilization operon repressor